MKKSYLIAALVLIQSMAWAGEKTHEKYHNVGNLSFISSQIPVDKDNILVSTDIDAQIQQTFKNLVEVASEAGAIIENGKIKNVVKLNVYLSDIGNLSHVDKYLLDYLTGSLPARTSLGGINYGSAGYLISMDAIVELQQP